MWPVVTFRIKYPVGIGPDAGSAVNAAGRIWIQVPGVPGQDIDGFGDVGGVVLSEGVGAEGLGLVRSAPPISRSIKGSSALAPRKAFLFMVRNRPDQLT